MTVWEINNYFTGIEVPSPEKLICCIETPGGISYSKQSDPSAADILNHIRKLKEDLYDGPPLIKVWVGERCSRINPLTDYPTIQENSLIPTNYIYLLAGVGVICGVNAYEKIWEIGFLAIWDENPHNKKRN